MNISKETAAKAMRAILGAVVESVKAAGDDGATGGILYSALMTHGATLAQFEQVMSMLVEGGFLRKDGQKYFWIMDLPS